MAEQAQAKKSKLKLQPTPLIQEQEQQKEQEEHGVAPRAGSPSTMKPRVPQDKKKKKMKKKTFPQIFPSISAESEVSSAAAAEGPEAKSEDRNEERLRKQVEYYFRDENLRYDKYLHSIISKDPDGWVDANLILNFYRMKRMNATKDRLLVALRG